MFTLLKMATSTPSSEYPAKSKEKMISLTHMRRNLWLYISMGFWTAVPVLFAEKKIRLGSSWSTKGTTFGSITQGEIGTPEITNSWT